MRLLPFLVICYLCACPAAPGQQAPPPAQTEPTNAAEAAAQKATAAKELDQKYFALVAQLPPDQQAWERLLQENLGNFYLPLHKADKLAGRSTAWDFVPDDPKLPRVLLIGDSVSRGYTQAVREALKGKANVHRAPENCGPTANGLKKIEVWLGDGHWDVIHFNFGIHDRATPLNDYTQRLNQLVERMKKTGAKLVWASTTPIPDDPAKKQSAASIIERNQAAAEVMQQRGVAIDDLFTAITPRLQELQNPHDVHFNAKGYQFLGQQAAASIAAALAAVAPQAVDARPNVLFLFADDQRADTIHALGNAIIQTPNLDRLVRRGVAFQRAYMQGGLQPATCVPSRAMLLSGRSLFRADVNLMRDETWPEAFGRAGYTTFVTGKWHNGDASVLRSFQIARSIFTSGMANPLQAKLRNVVDGRLGPAVLAPKHACEVFADETIGFLHEPHHGPFFCYVPFDAPHDPHIVPPDFPIHYDPAAIPLPASYLPQHPWDNGEMTVRDELLLPWPRTPEAVRGMLADYYRYISFLDAQIGRILDALEASPEAANTIVVFSADSGVARGSHGLIGKQNVYELDSVRVPLIIAGPGIPQGATSRAMCYLFDVLPTLGRLCGVSGPATSEGIDFSASLHDPTLAARKQMMFAYREGQRGWCDDRWKLIRYPQVDKTQLFDLQADPEESLNLAGDPAQTDRIKTMMGLLEQEQAQFGDSLPLRVEHPQAAEWTPPVTAVK